MGGASGIGAAVCARLVAGGGRVHAADRTYAAGEGAGEAGHDGVHRHALEVTDEAGWEALMQRLLAAEGHLDILVNSAGVSGAGTTAETSFEEWRRVLGVNLDGAFLATRHAIRAMGERGGTIVHIGSASGLRPAAGAAAYSTSKAALAMLARVAAKECRTAGWPIRVNVVSPAGVQTPMWSTMPFFQALVREHGSEAAAYAAMTAAGGGAFRRPEDVAEVVAFLAGDAGRAITGVEVPVDDGYVL